VPKRPKCQVIRDAGGLYVVISGLKIAKRGLPNTPQAGTWVSIEPGYVVRDIGDLESIEIEYQHQSRH
jgi:hypothetical protein